MIHYRNLIPILTHQTIAPDIYDTATAANGALSDTTYAVEKGKRIISNAASNNAAIASNQISYSNASNLRLLNYTKNDNSGIILNQGHCLACDFTFVSGTRSYLGYGTTNAAFAASNESASLRILDTSLEWRTPGSASLGAWNNAHKNRFYIIRTRNNGCYLLRRSVADSIVRLVWINDSAFAASTALFPFVNANASAGLIDNLIHTRLGSTWRSADPLRIATIGAISSGQTFSILADGFWARNIPMVSGQTVDWCFRYTDDNNYVAVRLAPSDAGVNPNTSKLVKKVAGLETELASVSRTLTPATTYEIKVRAEGSSITAWASLTRIGDVTDAFNSTVAGGKIINGTITSGRDYPAIITGKLKQQLEAIAL